MNKQPDSNKDDDVDHLSEEMKLAMKLSMIDQTGSTNTNSSSKETAFEYLTVMYILQIRHNDLSECNNHLASITAFQSTLKISMVNSYTSIDEETPISSSAIEAIFIDRFQKPFAIENSSFKYMLNCYQRCNDFETRINTNWTGVIPQKDQLQIIQNIQGGILTFCGILLSTPDLTNMDDFHRSQQEFQHILASPPKGRDFPKNFLSRLFEQIEDDSMSDILEQSMSMIQLCSRNPLRSSIGPCINTLIKLSTVQPFALYMMDSSKSWWIPNEHNKDILTMKQHKVNASKVVFDSILGGLLSISFDSQDIKPMFANIATERIKEDMAVKQQIKSTFDEYRLIINGFQDGIYSVLNNFIRIKNKKCKENVLRLLSYFIYINLDRGKMRYNPMDVSSDGFMLNLNYVLLKLCDPIIKKNMVNKIDSHYFLMNKAANYTTWEEATRLSCDVHELQAYTERLYGGQEEEKKENEPVSFGFTTEIYCLTLEALHLGFSCVSSEMSKLQRTIDIIRRDAAANPMLAMMANMRIKQFEVRLISIISHIMDQRFMMMVGRFYGFFCRWILYLSQQSNSKELLSIIPEYYVEDLSRFFTMFLTEPQFIQLANMGQSPFNRQSVIQCLIYLMGNDTPIRNIYQRACLCETLLYFLPHKVLQADKNPFITWHSYEFEQHEFNVFESCKTQLVSALLALYNDVERTGSPGQYYEKFKFRTIITITLKFLFSYSVHQRNLVLFAEKNEEKFIGFLNMLINDLIYTLDHGFDGLTEIRQIENEPPPQADANDMAAFNPFDPFGQQQPPQNEAAQRESHRMELKDTVRHYMKLANESIDLLKFVIEHTTKAFMNELIFPRVAVLVSVYLDRLAHGAELRVRGNLREDYNFNAKFLLTSVVQIFNRLCQDAEHKEMFLDAIVDDEAHFRESSYQKGIQVLRKKQLMNSIEIDKFEQTLNVLIRKFEEKKNIEHMLGDIPMKYLDPIMQTLMTDPVILGKKNVNDKNRFVMDRKVIERHLMNNPNNPFNREPLSKEDLVPDMELKQEIDEWIKTTLAKYKKKNESNDNHIMLNEDQ